MTEYFITLPKMDTVHKPNLIKNSRVRDDVKLALQSFDTDGQAGLSSDELLSAFDYFVKKEKEIAVTGKKGDGIISSKDIEKILKTNIRFEHLRQKYNDDSKAIELLVNTITTLSNIVSNDKSTKVCEVKSKGYDGITKSEAYPHYINNSPIVQAKLVDKNVNGARIKAYKSSDGEEYVTTADGRKYNKDYAAKYLGYRTRKTWFVFGENNYYEIVTGESKRGMGDTYGRYRQYKKWDDATLSFKNGKLEHIEDCYYSHCTE